MKTNKNNILMMYHLRYKGAHSIAFVNTLIKNDIEINSMFKGDDYLDFYINEKNYHKIKALDLSSYSIEVVKVGGLKKLLFNTIKRVGVLIGVVICVLITCIFHNKILQIHITGLENVSKEDVLQELKNYGVSYMSSVNIDKDTIEDGLASTFKFSLVSVVQSGNVIIINIKESLPKISDKYLAIVSDYNMLIEDIEVHSGKGVVDNGFFVYKGDVLVEPYYEVGSEKTYVCPCATIKGLAFFNASYVYHNSNVVEIRSGNKQLVSVEIFLGNNRVYSQQNDVSFEKYEIEVCSSHVSMYLLPLTIKKNYAYELVESEVINNFEQDKDLIVNNLKEDCCSQLPNGLVVSSEDVEISPINNGYIINVYMTSKVILNYKYKE